MGVCVWQRERSAVGRDFVVRGEVALFYLDLVRPPSCEIYEEVVSVDDIYERAWLASFE